MYVCSPITIFPQNYCNWFSRIILTSNLNPIQTNFPQQSKRFFLKCKSDYAICCFKSFNGSRLQWTKYEFHMVCYYQLQYISPVLFPTDGHLVLYTLGKWNVQTLSKPTMFSLIPSHLHMLFCLPDTPSLLLPLFPWLSPLVLYISGLITLSLEVLSLCHSAFPLALVSLARGPSCVFLHLWGFACISVALIILNYNLWLIDSWLYRWPNQELFSPSD